MSYTRAFSTLGCPQLSLAEVFALAEKFSLGAVEVRALEGSIDLPEVFKRRYGTPANLASLVAGQQIKIVSLDTSWSLTSSSEQERDNFLSILPWAEAMGVRHLRVFDGLTRYPASGFALATKAIQEWRHLRNQEGWKADLLVETHDVFLDGISIREFSDANGGISILWDTHHTWKAGEDPVATWQKIWPLVKHIHVKDSVSRRPGDRTYDYSLPGRGEFPMASLLTALRQDGFAGNLSLEWERLWHPELPSIEEALDCANAMRWW